MLDNYELKRVGILWRMVKRQNDDE
jgi:hypothetical protein